MAIEDPFLKGFPVNSVVKHQNKGSNLEVRKSWILLEIVKKSEVILFIFGISNNELAGRISCLKKFNLSIM